MKKFITKEDYIKSGLDGISFLKVDNDGSVDKEMYKINAEIRKNSMDAIKNIKDIVINR